MSSGRVFISHSSDNREQASELAAFLERHGARVWIAPRDVRPGMDYSEQLQLAIEQCLAFVVLVTEPSNKSPYVRAETEMAFSTNKPIFPIRMSDIQPAAGLALFLKIRHWTDAYGPAREENLARLAREIRALSGLTQIGDEPVATTPPKPAEPAPPPPPPPPPAAPQPAVAADAPVPPAPSPPPSPPVPLPTTADEEARWRTAIGPKADYYLEHWRRMEAKSAAHDWNWAACLLSTFWLAYRKMWGPLAGFIVANIVVGVIGAGAGSNMLGFLLTIALTFITGYFGNHWYRKQVGGLVAEAGGLDQAAALAQLERRGGVSVPAVMVLLAISLGLVLLAMIGAVAQMAQQQQQQQNLIDPPSQNLFGDKPVMTEDPLLPQQEQLPQEEPVEEQPLPEQPTVVDDPGF